MWVTNELLKQKINKRKMEERILGKNDSTLEHHCLHCKFNWENSGLIYY